MYVKYLHQCVKTHNQCVKYLNQCVKYLHQCVKYLPQCVKYLHQCVKYLNQCVTTKTLRSLADSMDVREDPKEAKKIAASQLKDWTQLQPNPAPCVPRCFPSTVSALWWAGLGRDTPLEQMATADLSLESQSEKAGQQQGEAESSVGPVPDDVSHVQVLVTGSLVMVGGALTLLQPDLWGQQ